MKHYVVGFLLTPTRVVLIRKNRPNWQAGYLNGIGGHVEEHETSLGAMIREFAEETGVDLGVGNSMGHFWTKFAELKGEFGHVDVFFSFVPDVQLDAMSVETVTDEKVEIHNLVDLPKERVLPSAHALIWFALEDAPRMITVQY